MIVILYIESHEIKKVKDMSDREIVRKEGRPVAFKSDKVEFVRCGRKCNPQEYTPNFKPKGLKCKKPRHKSCKCD